MRKCCVEGLAVIDDGLKGATYEQVGKYNNQIKVRVHLIRTQARIGLAVKAKLVPQLPKLPVEWSQSGHSDDGYKYWILEIRVPISHLS